MAKAIGEAAGGMARTLTLPMQQLAMAFSGRPALTDRNLKAKITEQSAESQFAAEVRKASAEARPNALDFAVVH